MRIIDPAEHRRTPWKNGGGETIELAIGPTLATLDNFEWRLSRARVSESGDFSIFEGCDRLICILGGGCISLRVGSNLPVQLDSTSEPFAFAADAVAHADLHGDPVDDLNLIWRRGVGVPRLTRLVGRIDLPDAMFRTLFYCPGGGLLRTVDRSKILQAGALVICERGEGVQVSPSDDSPLFKIELDDCTSGGRPNA